MEKQTTKIDLIIGFVLIGSGIAFMFFMPRLLLFIIGSIWAIIGFAWLNKTD